MPEKPATYNLKAVLKETGLAADTLRAWERRYGLPRPQRSAGGHRLYSRHDIQLIRWLMERQSEGLSISRAVELWQELSQAGQDPLTEYTGSGAAHPGSPLGLDELRDRWVAACYLYDEAAADEVLSLAFTLHPLESVIFQVLQMGLNRIGESWQVGRTSVQQEHFATALATRRLNSLISAAPAPTRKESILLACPPEEMHAFPLLVISLLLRRRGWRTTYLGSNVPIFQLEETLQMVHPDLVVMSAQVLETASTLLDAARFLAERGIPLAYGGRIFNRLPELRAAVPGHFLSEGLEAVPQQVALLLEKSAPPAASSLPEIPPLAQAYQRSRPHIEMKVRDSLERGQITRNDLDTALFFLGNTLLAALRLGSVEYALVDLDWLRGLSSGGVRPAASLAPFLHAYAGAVDAEMGPEGRPVSARVEAYAASL